MKTGAGLLLLLLAGAFCIWWAWPVEDPGRAARSAVEMGRGEEAGAPPLPGSTDALRRVRVRVVYKKLGDPVVGATVGIVESSEFKSDIEPVVTDARGEALLVGPPGGFGEWVYLLRPGEPVNPMDDRWQEELAQDVTELTIETLAQRTVRWQIASGVPPDGSSVRLLRNIDGYLPSAAPPPAGRIEGDWLIVPGWFAGKATARALSSEGTIAQLDSGWGAETGHTAEFVKAHALSFTLRHHDGTPAEGVQIVVSDWDRGSISARADASGNARIEAWPLGEARIWVNHGAGASEWIGNVRLDRPEWVLTHTLLRRLRFTLRIVGGDGKAPSIEVKESLDCLIRESLQFESEHAILRGAIVPPQGCDEVTLRIKQDDSETVELVAPASGDWSGEVRFKPQGELAFEVLGEAPDADTDLHIESEGDPDFYESVKAGAIADEIVRLPVGRWRLMLGYTQLSLGAFKVAKGKRTRLVVDWSRLATIRCEVRFPDGVPERTGAVVHGVNADLSRIEDGVYKGLVLADEPYRVWANHPKFIPHPEHGSYSGLGGDRQLTLRLERGPVASFRIDPKWGAATEVKLYGDNREKPAVQSVVPRRVGDAWTITGYVPGTYTAWFMTEKGVPWRVAKCALKERDMDMGLLEIRGGSRLRIDTLVNKPFFMPTIEGFLDYESRPYRRTERFHEYETGRWESPLLPKGRYEVGYWCGTIMWTRVFELDGVNDQVVEVDLR